MTAEQLAEKFHNLYETLAPEHGYETRKESAVSWENVPAKNKGLMIDVCKHLLATCQELTIDELTARFYAVKEQRDRFLAFCRVVCPTSDGSFSTWDHQTGNMFKELLQKDNDRLLEMIDEAASYCPIGLQDKIRKDREKRNHYRHPSRLLEALKAIADHEHCLTKHTVQGLRDIASAALQEIDPKNDYGQCVGTGESEAF